MGGASEKSLNCRAHTRSDKSISRKGGNNKDLESINALFVPTEVNENVDESVQKEPPMVVKATKLIEGGLNHNSSKKLNETEINLSQGTTRTLRGRKETD